MQSGRRTSKYLIPPLSAHHCSASPRSTCKTPSTSNTSAHTVISCADSTTWYGTTSYLAVWLVIDFVAHQDERKRVRISGLRLVQKLVSPLINGFERGPAGTSTKRFAVTYSVGLSGMVVRKHTSPWYRTPERNNLRHEKTLFQGSGIAPALPYPISVHTTTVQRVKALAIVAVKCHRHVGLCTCIATRVSSIIVSLTTKSEPIVAL